MNNKLVMGILAHVDSGKTTLSESILYDTGVIGSIGRVDQKDTFLDTDSVEKERGITIYSKDARLSIGNMDIVLIDTPGHVDFSTEMERVLSVLDVAVLLISASSGVQSHTKTLWSLLKSYRIPTYIFVNKMDMPGVDKDKLLRDIKSKLSDGAVDFTNDSNEEFYENIATIDESILNEYLLNGYIERENIQRAINSRMLYPVFFGSALKNEGVEEFIDGLDKYITRKEYDAKAAMGALVYKISRDSMGKRLTHLKVLSGSIKIKDILGNEKVNDIRLYSGNKYESVTEVVAGDICTIAGLADTKNNDVFGKNIRLNAPVLTPALSYAVKYPHDVDKTIMLGIMHELEEEDPALNVEYREQTGEIFVSLMGDVQTEVLTRNLKDRYGINVSFADGRICYKETIDHVVEGVGHFEPLRHYAEVHLRLEPIERNQGMEFDADVSEDVLAKNWQRLIMTHMMEREHRGVLTGSPLTDVKMTIVSGRAHIKHTEGGDFRQATYRAIRQGMMELRAIGAVRLLEPYYEYTLSLPDEYVGRAMTDITRMSGTSSIAENDHDNHITVLTGRAPVSTMNGYVKEVTAYTKGLGHLSLSISGYDLCHNEEEVLSDNRYDPDADLRNPSSSVFCSHGAGTVVPWNQVSDYMHIDYMSKDGALGTSYRREVVDANHLEEQAIIDEANELRRRREANLDVAISIEEIDSILHQSTHANQNGRQGSYKGISSSIRDRRKYESVKTQKETVYKGTKSKTKYILVDGYNVIHAWDELNQIANDTLDGAAGRLNDILCNYQAIKGINLMVVYDAYKVKGHSVEENPYNNITVVYTKEAQTADQYIERYAHENSGKYDITVITSDGLEQVIVTGNGASVMSSREFKEECDRSFEEFNARYNVTT